MKKIDFKPLTLLSLVLVYPLVGLGTIGLARIIEFERGMFNTSEILLTGVIGLVLTLLLYLGFKKTYREKTYQRVMLYAAFFMFSAVAIYFLLNPVVGYTDILRENPSGVNYLSIGMSTISFLALASTLTYLGFTYIIEVKERAKMLVQDLAAWFIVTVASGYASLLLLQLILGPWHWNNCVGGEALPRCRAIGDRLLEGWVPVPGISVLVLGTLLLAGYLYLQRKK